VDWRPAATAAMFGAGLIAGALALPAPARAQLDTQNLIPCAEEGGVCRMPHPTNVYFGVPGRTNGRPFPQGGSIACTVQSFGDPAPGVRKSCFYAPRIADRRRGGGGGGYEGGGYGGGYDRGRGPDEYDRRREYDRPPPRPYGGYDRPRPYRGEDDDE
jgi:hypothetical protein